MVNSSESSVKLDLGLASNFAFLVWAIWGGFILYMLESNYLAVLMQPKFEKPINTIEDVLKSNLNALYLIKGFDSVLRESPNKNKFNVYGRCRTVNMANMVKEIKGV